MTRLQKVLLTLLAGTLIGGAIPTQAQDAVEAEAAPQRTVIYLYSHDFPPSPTNAYALPALETKFWQLLDKEMQQTDNLVLTQALDEADYRVELRCAGFQCNKVRVDVKNPNRDVLTSFTVKNQKPPLIGLTNLELFTASFAQKLNERLKLLEQGGYGFIN